MRHVLSRALKEIVPKPEEAKHLNEISKEIISIVNSYAKREKVNAVLVPGGSVAKNTWLPGIHDLDFFLKFNYQTYANKSGKLADLTEKILRAAFKNIKRLHGSRDYFEMRFLDYVVEIIPVLAISKPLEMKNITDVSPLHVNWIAKQTRKSKDLANQIRLTKRFFKAVRVYGAESWNRGFSGHTAEILTCYFGSFSRVIRNIATWMPGKIIDFEKHYTSKQELMQKMNASKMQSPIIIVDPIQPERNASAAVSLEKFNLVVNKAKAFCKTPSVKYFKEKVLTLQDLKNKAGKRKLIAIRATPLEDKPDVAGAKILKKFKYIEAKFRQAGFKVLAKGWQWDEEHDALVWLYIDSKILPKNVRHFGPPVKASKENVSAFKKKYRKAKILRGKYYVDLPRKYRKSEDLIRALTKDLRLSGIKFLK